MNFFGSHINGGLERALLLANKYDFNSAQIMPTAPIRWAYKEVDEVKTIPLAKLGKRSKLKKILIHSVYLVNLARKEKQKFHLSKLSLLNYLIYAQKLIDITKFHKLDTEILGVCFHPGAALDLTREEGLDRVVKGINWIFDYADVLEAKLLLESTAGAGEVIGDKFEELAYIRDNVKSEYRGRIGYVLDTEHTWASGYDWRDNLDGVLKDVDKLLGFENIKTVHLNDSKVGLNSKKDRHANLGEGLIGLEAIQRLLKRVEFTNIPFILETPAVEKEEGIESEIEKIKKIIY